MSSYFSNESLDEIRRSITRSLADTFQMMFQLDIFVLPQALDHSNEQGICAHIDMENGDTKAILSISIAKPVVLEICKQLEPGITPPSHLMQESIVSEIANIVGNHLRTYISDKFGVEFRLSLPIGGEAAPPPQEAHRLNLHFRIHTDERLDLNFTYIDHHQVAISAC